MHRSRIVLMVAAALVGGVLIGSDALASHDFSDVADTHPFHSEISWLVDSGITEGYDDGTYRPAAPVSRGSMAAFLQRLAQSEQVEPRVWHADRTVPASVAANNPTFGLDVVVAGTAQTPLPAGTYEVSVSAVFATGSEPRAVACDFFGNGQPVNLEVVSAPLSLGELWADGATTPKSYSGTGLVELHAPSTISWRCWRTFGAATYPTIKANMIVEAVRDL